MKSSQFSACGSSASAGVELNAVHGGNAFLPEAQRLSERSMTPVLAPRCAISGIYLTRHVALALDHAEDGRNTVINRNQSQVVRPYHSPIPAVGTCECESCPHKQVSLCTRQRKTRVRQPSYQDQEQPTEFAEPPRSPSPCLPPVPPPSPANSVREIDPVAHSGRAPPAPSSPQELSDLLMGIDWDAEVLALAARYQPRSNMQDSAEGRYQKSARVIAVLRRKAMQQMSRACSRIVSRIVVRLTTARLPVSSR